MKLYVVENSIAEETENRVQDGNVQKGTPPRGPRRGRRAGKGVTKKETKTKQENVVPIIKLKTFKTPSKKKIRNNARLRVARSLKTQPSRAIMSPYAMNKKRTTIRNANIERNIHRPKAGPSTMTQSPRRSTRIAASGSSTPVSNNQEAPDSTANQRTRSTPNDVLREQSVSQNVSSTTDPAEEIGEDDDRTTCPATKIRQFFWTAPFLLLLDSIIEAGTEFQEIYNQYFPTVNPRTFNSAGRRYGVIEEEVGRIAYELAPHLGLDLPQRNGNPTVPQLKRARKQFERRYLEGLALIKNVRRMITSTPSIFWYFPANIVLRILAQYHCGVGTDAAHQLYTDIIGQYLNAEYAVCEDASDRFINCDVDNNCMKAQEHVLEHACRTFYNMDYRQGLKQTRTNSFAVQGDETPRTYYFRSSTHQSDENYRRNFINLRGYVFDCSDDGVGVWEHPLSDLASQVIGYFGTYFATEFMDGPVQVVAALCTEMDTCMKIAGETPRPTTDEGRARHVYGYRVGQNMHVRPWNLLQQHSSFLLQHIQLRTAISGGPNLQPQNDDYIDFFNCLKFHILVQDFSELYNYPHANTESILRDRMRAALSNPTPNNNTQ